ncbi:MAG: hypothetical protein ACLP0B_04930 [Steroidobacteraceae bacterium]|jgi:hypothetical protein
MRSPYGEFRLEQHHWFISDANRLMFRGTDTCASRQSECNRFSAKHRGSNEHRHLPSLATKKTPVSPHNNPALSLLMLATLKGYGFHWPLGADRLMLLSVGTGATPFKSTQQLLKRRPAIVLAIAALRSLMHDSDQLGQALPQWMSNSPTPWLVDGEVGNLADDVIGEKSLLHYLRYDAPLVQDWLVQELGLQLEPADLESIRAMDRPENGARLLHIGEQAAARQVSAEHFPGQFDLIPAGT